MKPTQWLAVIVASIGWASGGIATRAAFNEGVDAWTMIAFRVFFAAVLVGAVLVIRRVPLPSKVVLGYGLTQAVFNLTVPYVLFTFAYDEASAGFVGLLTALIPLSTAVAANFMLPDEPLSKGKLAGLLVAFSGVAFLLLSGDSGLSEGGRPLVAVGLGITAVTSVGFAAAFGKRHAGSYDPSMMTGLQFGFSAMNRRHSSKAISPLMLLQQLQHGAVSSPPLDFGCRWSRVGFRSWVRQSITRLQ